MLEVTTEIDINTTGEVVYTPASGYVGAASFDFTNVISTTGTVTITVTAAAPVADTAPAFPGGATIANLTMTAGTLVQPATLPRTATGGNGTLSYALTLAANSTGLSVTGGRTLAGTPRAGTATATWRVSDSDANRANSDTDTLTFTITVTTPVPTTPRDVQVAIAGALNQSVLPEAGRAVADNVMSAISHRLTSVDNGGNNGGSVGVSDGGNAGGMFRLGGQRTFADAIAVHGRALLEGRFDLNTALGNTDFVLPLSGGFADVTQSLTFWGGGDYRNLNGENGDSGAPIDWGGDLFSAYLGADVRLRDDLRGGVALSWSDSTVDYTHTNGVGDYALTMTGVHPYLGWSSADGRFTAHATAGYGWGDVEWSNATSERGSSDATLRTVGAGGSGRLTTIGDTALRLNGEIMQTAVDVDGADNIPKTAVEARRVRMTLEGSRANTFGDGSRLTQNLAVGLRHDAGDSRTGTGAEFSGAIRYVVPSLGLTVEGHGRGLVAHGGDYDDWGLGGQILLQPKSGDGLSMSIRPDYGTATAFGGGGGGFGDGGIAGGTLWNQGATALTNANTAANTNTRRTRVAANIGYALPFHDGANRLTPYGGLTLGATRIYRLGTRLTLADDLTLNLEGVHTLATPRALATHGVKLELGMDW